MSSRAAGPGRAEETREVTREEAEEVDRRLDAPGRGGHNTSQHEGHVRLEQVLGREDAYRMDRIAHWVEDHARAAEGWGRQQQKKPGRSPVKRPKKWTGV